MLAATPSSVVLSCEDILLDASASSDDTVRDVEMEWAVAAVPEGPDDEAALATMRALLASVPVWDADTVTLGLGQSATSHALRILRDRGIARATREGQMVRYHLADEALRGVLMTGWRHALDSPLPRVLSDGEQLFTGEIHVERKSAPNEASVRARSKR